MSVPAVDETRIYRGLNLRERAGWVLGLTPLQAIAVLGLGAPVLLSMSAGRWSEALLMLAINGVGVVLVTSGPGATMSRGLPERRVAISAAGVERSLKRGVAFRSVILIGPSAS